ncbi:chemotaxis protein-glutamate methylesterase [Skermanella stibiiresistens SB22]|uniref:protein-glutamate methylesterase n=1 Tax=Skermanella stibiiresistens SB22 TaxID=1385369 RepID=W9H885_9PROT|nr:chemotaxis protein CheB [Skermanella stibiiresistens]EWY40971.1 chemotaxis protein-glutamate methylesterase [Skermanella stibiiresistens SB22]
MTHRNIVVVGASAGGLGAIKTLLTGLSPDLAAAVFLVLHIGARRSEAARILDGFSRMPVVEAADGAPIRTGHVHVAPPDHHLVLEKACMRLTRGPRENGTRPSVDPLFRTAAENHGSRVVGIILSGTLGDGTAGLAAIRKQGGVAVVQEPSDAKYPGMPQNALLHAGADHRLPTKAMSDLLVQLSGTGPSEIFPPDAGSHWDPSPRQEHRDVTGHYQLNRPDALTCPSCGGALRQTTLDTSPYYTCHIGHRFAVADMDAGQLDKIEEAFSVAMRTLNERAELCRRMAEMARGNGQTYSLNRWEAAGDEARERATVLRRFLEQNWTSPTRAAETIEIEG